MVPGIVADVNIEGYFQHLLRLFAEPARRNLWEGLAWATATLEELGLPSNAPDAEVWITCQQHQLILITDNRNAKGLDSLEATIRTLNSPTSFPVFTLGDARRFLHDRAYAEAVADQLLEYLFDIEKLRGAGRMYLR
jgi:hypothetical protein